MILPPLKETRKLTPEEEKLERDLSQCVRCAVCLPTCPTYQITPDEGHSPRGRISLVRAMHEGEAHPARGMHDYLDACLQCRACETACPNNVEFHKVIAHGHQQMDGDQYRGFWGRLFKRFFLGSVFASSRSFDRFMGLLRLYQKSGLQWLIRTSRLLHLLPWKLGSLERMVPTGLGAHKPIRKKTDQLLIPAGEIHGSVNFFTGCIADHWLQPSAHAAIRTLLRLGFQVHIPAGQQCCGALHEHLGDADGAARLARKNMQAFAGNTDQIVLHAAGCGAMLGEYREHFAYSELESEAARFSDRIIDFSQLVAAHLERLQAERPLEARAMYDDPCHLIHAQGVSREPRQILAALPGLEYVELEEASWCCGSAGVYNVTHYDWSQEFLQRKLEHVEKTGADLLITANPGCYLQLRQGVEQAGLPLEVVHLAEVIDRCFAAEPHLSSHSDPLSWQ